MTIINLIFSPGRGSCDTLSREATQGTPYGALPTARRSGYVFDGWFTAPQGDPAAERVAAADLVRAAEDMTLYAHYTKNTAPRKRSSLRTQRAVAVGLVAAIALLVAVLLAVNYIVSIVSYTDPADGATYRARRVGGVYTVFDAAGHELPVNEDGYYLSAAGTQLALDPDTGKITSYAVVDVEGMEQVGTSNRILMFPQIRQADVARIEVTNAHGSYAMYVDAAGQVQIEGFETDRALVSYDPERYAYLCAGAGNPLTIRKLDTAEAQKRGYAEYGLVSEMRVDADGNAYAYEPARYTVTSTAGAVHTVLIGDPIVSGAGYYVKLEGDEHPAVYVMSNMFYDKALLCRVEDMITPMINYPTTAQNYVNVENFIVASIKDGEAENLEIEVAFDTIGLEKRENTMYSTEPYQAAYGGGYRFSGYRLDDSAIGEMLYALYSPAFEQIVKLGPDDETLRACGLDRPRWIIDYDFMASDTDEKGNAVTTRMHNRLYVSERTDRGTYYVLSEPCRVVAEISGSSFSFLENSAIDWVDPNPVWINLAYLKTITLNSPAGETSIALDNSKSDQSAAISSQNITFRINGVTPDYIVYKTEDPTGNIIAETPVYNLRQFYRTLLSLTIAGEASQGGIALDEEQMATLRAQPDSACQLVLTLDAEDMAAVYNSTYYKENNTSTLTYRFYRYSEGRSYMTINGQGEFFVDANFVEKIIADAARLENGVLIDASAKH